VTGQLTVAFSGNLAEREGFDYRHFLRYHRVSPMEGVSPIERGLRYHRLHRRLFPLGRTCGRCPSLACSLNASFRAADLWSAAPDMEFSLLARARVQFSDFGQRHLDGGDVWWVKDLQRASRNGWRRRRAWNPVYPLFITLDKAGLSRSEMEIARAKASQMQPTAGLPNCWDRANPRITFVFQLDRAITQACSRITSLLR